MSLTLPLDAEVLIPHRLPMRLVDRLLEIDHKNGVVEALITADCPLVSADGRLEQVAMAELLAQAYATIKGYCDRIANLPVKQGFLVGVKKITRFKDAHAGDLLLIKITTLAELDAFFVAEGEIWRGKELLARGDVKVWVH